jgi:O-antigen/teichoic acid export membrane protein
VAQLVTARIIGPDSYGIYAYVLAWVTLLGYFSTLGFHVSLLRFVPAYQAKEEWALVARRDSVFAVRHCGTAVSIVLIGVCGIVALHGSLRPELALSFLLGIAAVPFLALHFINASVVRAFGGIISSLAPERIVRDGLSAGDRRGCLLGQPLPSRCHAGDGGDAPQLASHARVLVRIFLRRLRPPALDHAKPAYTAKDWWRPTLPLTVMMIADNLMSRSAVIALGLAGNTRDAGIFAVAFSMTILTALPRMAVATVFAPTVSALFARAIRPACNRSAPRRLACHFSVQPASAIPLLLLAQPLLAWFGRDFVAGAPIVMILVLGQLFSAACGPQQHLITMTGHERIGATMLAVCAGSNFVGCLLMIDSFGMTGAALATRLALVAWNAAMGVFIYRRLHLMPGLIASFKAIPRRKRSAHCEV